MCLRFYLQFALKRVEFVKFGLKSCWNRVEITQNKKGLHCWNPYHHWV